MPKMLIPSGTDTYEGYPDWIRSILLSMEAMPLIGMGASTKGAAKKIYKLRPRVKISQGPRDFEELLRSKTSPNIPYARQSGFKDNSSPRAILESLRATGPKENIMDALQDLYRTKLTYRDVSK